CGSCDHKEHQCNRGLPAFEVVAHIVPCSCLPTLCRHHEGFVQSDPCDGGIVHFFIVNHTNILIEYRRTFLRLSKGDECQAQKSGCQWNKALHVDLQIRRMSGYCTVKFFEDDCPATVRRATVRSGEQIFYGSNNRLAIT